MKKTIRVILILILIMLFSYSVSKADAETVPTTIDVDVITSWVSKDEDNMPKSVTVKLLANGVDTGKTLVLTAKDNWKGVFAGQPEFDEDGKRIEYTIVENPVFGFDTEVKDETEKEETKKEEWVQVEEPKEDEDSKDDIEETDEYIIGVYDWTDGNKLKEVDTNNSQLKKSDVKQVEDTDDGKVKIKDPDKTKSWKITKNDDGTYIVNKEENKDLTLDGKQSYGWYGPSYDYNFVISEYVKNNDGNGWEGQTSTNHQNKIRITPMGDGTVLISAIQDWGSSNNETGKEKYLYIKSDGTFGVTDNREWAGRFVLFQKRIVTEINKIEYKFEIECTPNERTFVTVRKEWKDGEKKHEKESFKVYLMANGKKTGRTITLKKSNDWKGEFDNLVKYDEDGNKIEYSVYEENSKTHKVDVETEKKIEKDYYFVVIKDGEDLKDGEYILAFFDWTEGNNEYRPIWIDSEESKFKYGDLGFVHESEITITDTKGDVYDEYLKVGTIPEFWIWNLKNEDLGKTLENAGKFIALKAEQYNGSIWGWLSMFRYYFVAVDPDVQGWYNANTEEGGPYGANYNKYLEIELNDYGAPNRYISSIFGYDGNYRDENGNLIEKPWYGSFEYNLYDTMINGYDSISGGGSFKFLKKVELETVEEDPYAFVLTGESTGPEHDELDEEKEEEKNEEPTLPKTGAEWSLVGIILMAGIALLGFGIILDKKREI